MTPLNQNGRKGLVIFSFGFLLCIILSDVLYAQSVSHRIMEATLDGRGGVAVQLKEEHEWRRVPVLDFAAAAKCNVAGHKLFKAGDNPGALEQFQKAQSLDPNNPEYAENVGFLAMLIGLFPQARQALHTCLDISPGRASAWYTLGRTYAYLNQEEQAYACIVTACIFSKNRDTTLRFIEKNARENACMEKIVINSLETCAGMTAGGNFHSIFSRGGKAPPESKVNPIVENPPIIPVPQPQSIAPAEGSVKLQIESGVKHPDPSASKSPPSTQGGEFSY